MQQPRLNNATTMTQQCNNNYSTNATYYACGTDRVTTPFAKVIIRLVRLQPPSLKNNRVTVPFAKVIIRLDRLQPPSLDNAYATTQLKMQQSSNITSLYKTSLNNT